MIIVKTQIKDAIAENGNFSISSDLAESLDKQVKEILKKACERAKANNRRTVMSRDL